jgi:hypothetical protein|tara:strand:- start:65 stop:202 length:138 start_codon:yes stop_codon:yes gene_type:complete
MIKEILKLLKSHPFLIGDEDIDIAKGKYEAPTNFKENKLYKLRNT